MPLHLTRVRGLLRYQNIQNYVLLQLHLTRVRGLLLIQDVHIAPSVRCTLPVLGDCYQKKGKKFSLLRQSCTLPVLGDCYSMLLCLSLTDSILHLTRIRGLLLPQLRHLRRLNLLHLTYPETKQRFPKWKALHHFFTQSLNSRWSLAILYCMGLTEAGRPWRRL